ncbi:MAG: polysaccharide deacetylase family protein [Phycisphaerae bacterium]|nr:polysaccharide deacetylase family protein [Phycisphaerae bacterium]
MTTFIIAGIFISVFFYIAVPWVHGRWARILLKRRAGKYNVLALTFDDGPGSRLTPAILDILAENNGKATFFLLGKNIAGREEIVRQIAEQGHEIGSHGYDHLHYWKVSPFRAIKDIKRGWAAIDAALGNRGRYVFRPPYGKLNIFCLLYLWIHRVRIVYWTLDSGDTWQMKCDSRKIAVLTKEAGGAVLLAHDFDRSDSSVDDVIIDSIRATLAIAHESRLRTLTVSQLLER